MGKVSYTNLKLKVNTDVEKIILDENTEIEVLKYLPIEDKYDLIAITLQKSKDNDIYNPLMLDMYFHLYLIYLYTNISFTDKQKENEQKLYDTLKSNGIIDKVLEAIPEEEYDDLLDFMDQLINIEMNYNNSAAGVIRKLVDDLPKNAQAANDIVNNFDKEKFQNVINFAQAANGNRPI
jgi:hypothetical protein